MSEEKEYRKKAHTFIYDSCQLLKTKALVIAAAQTICQRYFSQVSFRKIDRNVSETPLFGYVFPAVKSKVAYCRLLWYRDNWCFDVRSRTYV